MRLSSHVTDCCTPPRIHRLRVEQGLFDVCEGYLGECHDHLEAGSSVETMSETAASPRRSLRLWYEQPARQWIEALPVGNGRLGAMVFGRIDIERIQLNEDSIWYGGPRDRVNPDALEHLPEVRRLLFAGQPRAAELLARGAMLGTPCRQNPYQPLGDLELRFFGRQGEATDYQRDLGLGS